MSYEIQGYLYKKFPTENKSGNFQVREFVIKTEGEYPQFVKLQLSNDKCSHIDDIAEGWKVKASFNIKGREWEGKFFVSLAAWKVTVEGRTTSTGHHQPGNQPEPLVEDADVVDGEGATGEDGKPVPF